MEGNLSHEMEVGVAASKVWEIYGSIQLAYHIDKLFPGVFEKLEVVEGDGGVGTVLNITFSPGKQGPRSYKEKFMKIDETRRIREIEVVEGGYLELGFSLYRVRLEIIEKDSDSSIIKSSIEYKLREEFAANASLVSIDDLAIVAGAISKYLIEKTANA